MDSLRLWRSSASRAGFSSVPLLIAVPVAACIGIAGCSMSRVNKQARAVSASLTPVIEQSAAAYKDAVALHNLREDYEAVVAYENKDASYNPRAVPVLLSERDIQARIVVLAALQVYSRSLIEMTRSTDTADLDDAAKSAGNNLTSFGNDLAPSVENVLGIAASSPSSTTTTTTTVSGSNRTTTSTTTAAAAPLLSAEAQNGISTAVDALGQFFVSRTLARELPGKIAAMDPTVQTLCATLSGDIAVLDDIERRDYDRILNLEKQFILEDAQAGKDMNPEAWRAEVMKLPEIARQQKEAHERLVSLREAIDKLARTHHALAAQAQQSSPESMKDKLNDLADAGTSLGNFYSSLSTK